MTSIDIAALIDRKPGGFYVKLSTLLVLVMFFDGYNLQAISYAAPAIIREWHLPRSDFTPIFSSGLFGLLIGSVGVSYLGDRYGRKRGLILGGVLFGIVTLLTAKASSLDELMALRFLAGIGVGGVYPNAVALNVEYAPPRFRATSVAILFIGYAGGAAAGGLVAWALMPAYGWPVIFWLGGLLPLGLVAVLAFALPESARFLAFSPGRRGELAAILLRIDPSLVIDAETSFILREDRSESGKGPALLGLFREGRGPITALLWLATASNLMTLHFLASWMPTVLHDASVTSRQAALATSLFHLSGSLSGVGFSRMVDRFGVRVVAATAGLGVLLVMLIGTPGLSPPVLMLLVVGTGAGVIGSQVPINAASAILYPTNIRSSGAGWQTAVGRIGSILGPTMGGVLISLRLPMQQLFWAAAVPIGCSAICCLLLGQLLNRRSSEATTGSLAKASPGRGQA